MNPTVRLLSVAVGLRSLGVAIYLPFLALALVDGFAVPYVLVGAILGTIGACQIPLNVIGGFLADRFERKRLLLACLFGESISLGGLSVAFALRSLPFAIGAAVAGGAFASQVTPVVLAYMADVTAGADRARAFSLGRIGFNAGYSAGAALGGILATAWSYAGSVAVTATLLGAGAIVVLVGLEPSPRDTVRREGRLSIPSERTSPRPPSPRPEPPGLGWLARDRLALGLMVAFGLGALVAGQYNVTLPLFAHSILGLSYELVGIGLAINGLLVVATQHWVTEGVIGRRHTTVAVLGLLFFGVSYFVLGLRPHLGLPASGLFLGAIAILTVGENLYTIPQLTLPSNVAPAHAIGLYNGAFSAVGALGLVGATVLGGIALGAGLDPLVTWSLLVVPAVPSILLFRVVGARLSRTVNRI